MEGGGIVFFAPSQTKKTISVNVVLPESSVLKNPKYKKGMILVGVWTQFKSVTPCEGKKDLVEFLVWI
jgi:hypothetical protein